MKKSLILLVAVALCVAMLFGCAQETQKEYTIELEGNPTTGYTWEYTVEPDGILKEVSGEYVADETDENTAGAGGKYVYVLDGVKEGEATLEFSYVRDWEEEEEPETRVFVLTVDADGNITGTEK